MSEKKILIIEKLKQISAEIEKLKLELKTKEQNITQLNKNILSASDSEKELESTIERLNGELVELKSNSTKGNVESQSQIEQLKQEIYQLSQEKGEFKLTIKRLKEEIENLNTDTDSILEEVAEIEKQVKSVADGGRKKSRSRRKTKSMKQIKKKSKKKSMKQIKKSKKKSKKKSRKKSRKSKRRF